MSLLPLAQEYDQLPPGEQALFADAVRRLLADGFIWREDEESRKLYNFLARRSDLVGLYLQVSGWRVTFHEPTKIYYVTHVEGAHRRRLNKDTTIWLLLFRLLHAEQREKLQATLTRYPIITVGQAAERYAEFFPGQTVRKRTSLDEALRTLHSLKLIRPATGGALRAAEPDKLIELLPALEVILPAQEIAALVDQLHTYQPDASAGGEATEPD
jgi:Domain of unknown function (DUF4194)